MTTFKVLAISLISFFGLLFLLERAVPDHFFFEVEGANNLVELTTENTVPPAATPESTCPLHPEHQLSWHAQIDPATGEAGSYLLLPADWKVEGPRILGPHGEKIVHSQGKSFVGKKAPTLEELIEQRILPMMQSSGVEVTGKEVLPAVARHLAAQAGHPAGVSFYAMGVEYTDGDKRGFTIVVYGVQPGEEEDRAFYQMTDLSCPADCYAEDKVHFIQAMSQVRTSVPEATGGVTPAVNASTTP